MLVQFSYLKYYYSCEESAVRKNRLSIYNFGAVKNFFLFLC